MKGGCVISSTITKYAYVLLNVNANNKEKRINSIDYGLVTSFKTVAELKYDGNLDLVKAALKVFQVDDYGFDMMILCDAPPGSGLGSSSAIMVAIIGALKELMKKPLTSYEIAELAYKLERIELGIKGGLQDQYAATFGGFNFIEFKKDSVVVNPLKIKSDILNELHSNLILFDTGKTRLSAKILERQISATQRRENVVIESLDFLKKIAIEMKNALLRGDLDSFSELLHLSWEYKKRLDVEISNPLIDKIYEAARRSGAVGGKLCGAGGGGHLLIYCDLEKRHAVIKRLKKFGCKVVPFNFESDGLQTWEILEKGVRI